MRTTVIVTMMMFVFNVVFAQRERQMQRPDAVVKSNTQNAAVVNAPSESRKMIPIVNDRPVPATKGITDNKGVVNNEKREMVPLNPNEPAKKKN